MFEKQGSYLFKNKICPNMEQVVCSLQAVLPQAKNGDELFCEERDFMQPMLSGCLDFF
jgi:hypothetical protein